MLILSAVSASTICGAVMCSSVCSERYLRSCLRCRVRYLTISHPSNLQLICKLVYRTALHLSICELIANRGYSARSGTVQRAPSNGNSFPRATLLKKNLKKFAFWVRVFPILCTYISESTFRHSFTLSEKGGSNDMYDTAIRVALVKQRVRENTRWM